MAEGKGAVWRRCHFPEQFLAAIENPTPILVEIVAKCTREIQSHWIMQRVSSVV